MTIGSWKALVGMLVLTMGTSMITPLLPLYQDRFALSTATATLLFVSYTVTVCPTMLVAGNLSDRLGRKRLLMPAMAVMTRASLAFALADSVPPLFAGRVLQGLAIGAFLGVGAAFVVDTVAVVVAAAALIGFMNGFILYGGTVICGTIVPIGERGKLMSVLYMCAYAGTIPTVGLGYLADAIGLTPTLGTFSLVAVAMAAVVPTVGRRRFAEVVPHDHVVVPPRLARPAATG